MTPNTMNRLILILLLGLMTSEVKARIYVHITGEEGVVDYDMAQIMATNTLEQGHELERALGRGWYMEPNSPSQKYSVVFKQGERCSTNPVQVATLKSTQEEHFVGKSALEFQIIARKENKPGSTAAYKVALDLNTNNLIMVEKPKDWFLGFAMKIDPVNYSLPEGTNGAVLFQQWWQGSPMHPPISLEIVNQTYAGNLGWRDADPKGNFALAVRDVDHNPGGPYDKGQAKYFDLGPVHLGQWIRWVVCVRPDPSGKDGRLTVWMDDEKKLDLYPIVVGFNQDPAKGIKMGNKSFSVNPAVYRSNGSNTQRIFFDEIKIADSLEEVQLPKSPSQSGSQGNR